MTEWPSYAVFRPIETWPRELTKNRRVAPFRAGWSKTLTLLRTELENLGGRQIVIQMALAERDLRLDGFPRAGARPDHPGVIVALESKHGPLQYPCDTFDYWQDNVRAIALALNALRAVDRYGVTSHGEQYRGWRQLESGEKTQTRHEAVITLMGIAWPEQTAKAETAAELLADPDMLRGVIRAAQKVGHPDRGGSDETWAAISRAVKVLG